MVSPAATLFCAYACTGNRWTVEGSIARLAAAGMVDTPVSALATELVDGLSMAAPSSELHATAVSAKPPRPRSTSRRVISNRLVMGGDAIASVWQPTTY